MIQKSVKVPCTDGTLLVVLQAEAARFVDDVLLLIRALDHYPDRSAKGMAERIQRNIRAQADWDSVQVFIKLLGPDVTSKSPAS